MLDSYCIGIRYVTVSDQDISVDYDDYPCLNWKEILNMIDDYYKVNSFLVGHDTLIYKNVILPKLLCSCIIRFELIEGMAHGEEDAREEWKSLTTMKVASTREAREEVEPSMKRDSIRTSRSHEFETVKVYSYEVQIKQRSTGWKGNYKSFPTDPTPNTGSTRTSLGDQNKSTAVSCQFPNRVL